MLWVEGFKLGRRTRVAFDQSTRFALSCASQNFRSCASELNLGILVFAIINLPLLSMHVTGRDYSDQGSIHSQRKRDMQSPSVDRDTASSRGNRSDRPAQ